jgi:hypothetical protein
MARDRLVDIKPPASQAARERDVAIRSVREQLMQFMERKLVKERGKELRSLGPDVACMVEGLADCMAMIHFDLMRAVANRDPDSHEPKLSIVREPERNR